MSTMVLSRPQIARFVTLLAVATLCSSSALGAGRVGARHRRLPKPLVAALAGGALMSLSAAQVGHRFVENDKHSDAIAAEVVRQLRSHPPGVTIERHEDVYTGHTTYASGKVVHDAFVGPRVPAPKSLLRGCFALVEPTTIGKDASGKTTFSQERPQATVVELAWAGRAAPFARLELPYRPVWGATPPARLVTLDTQASGTAAEQAAVLRAVADVLSSAGLAGMQNQTDYTASFFPRN